MTAISTSRGRRAIRTAATVGAVSLGLVVLSACEKPTPNAHFTLGSSTTSPEAAGDCYGHGETLGAEQAEQCLTAATDVPVFDYRTGDEFRIGVDPKVADSGWLLFVNDNPLEYQRFTSTYRTLSGDLLWSLSQNAVQQSGDGTLRISVAEVTEDFSLDKLTEIAQTEGQQAVQTALYDSVKGVWNAELSPADED
ncbi:MULTISPECIES: hypothetical protein [Streptomyces]|uniref:DUF2771 domain-containing protein n=1 Tax=Streptomyces harbinensis TaxID=1176198 RepID=A0A1I6NZ33_9ACTN|nr:MULTISPECIES: hypothetical protein [Streptomyces]MCK1816603.1 hypothetical protein [Streptomyces sp. XM4011]QKV70206.1 hypothetical protein HUT13_16575 [Streptomyces harbinensis]SFS33105.1 hypothetical protein SAMN05444716_101151 [Streptomyces harbinensis]